MTDVMTVGTYPDQPVPGPRYKTLKERTIEGLIDLANEAAADYRILPVCCWPKEHFNPILDFSVLEPPWPPADWVRLPKNPILEDPMYFPGRGAWKGTSGMPQHRYA